MDASLSNLILTGHQKKNCAQLLKQKLTISEILREYGKKFTQIKERYSDGHNGRCAIGVIMSYYGWNGKDDSQAPGKLLGALIALRHAGIDKNLLIDLNDLN
jgi:hypothetical protein